MIGGNLPEHMKVGRGSFSGPLTGPYMAFSFGPHTDAGAIAANTVVAAMICPMNFRVEAIAYAASDATADCDLMITHNATLAVGGTELLTAAAVPWEV